MEYGELHRFFLRTIMNRCVLSQTAAENIINNHSKNDNCQLQDVIGEINKKIRPLSQQIKFITNDCTGSKEIVFLSLGWDEAARCQTLFSPAELEYFKFLLEEIMLSEKKIITGIAALNVASRVQIHILSKTRAQELLDNLCILRYIKKSPLGYSLDTRGIHEFDTYFHNNFPDYVDICFLCKQTAFQVKSCIPCGENFHTRCLKKYLDKISKCPNCKIPHTNMNETSQGSIDDSQAVDDSNEYEQQSESQLETVDIEIKLSPVSSQQSRKRKNR